MRRSIMDCYPTLEPVYYANFVKLDDPNTASGAVRKSVIQQSGKLSDRGRSRKHERGRSGASHYEPVCKFLQPKGASERESERVSEQTLH